MKRSILALPILFLLASCSLKPLPSQKIIFMNRNFESVGKIINNHCKVNVDYSNCNNAFDSYTVYVQTGRNQLEPLSNYEWIDTPCNMVKDSIQDTLNSHGCYVGLGVRNELSFDLIKFQPVLLNKRHFCEIKVDFRFYVNGKQYFTLIDKKGKLKNNKSFASCMSKLMNSIDVELVKWIDKKIGPTKWQAH